MNKIPRVRRLPIVLNHTAVGVMEIYSRPSTITDEFGFFWEAAGNDDTIDFDAQAKEFIQQLGEEECLNFMTALRGACDEYVKEWEKRHDEQD